MELDAKDCDIEQLRQKLACVNIDTASLNNSSLEDSESSGKPLYSSHIRFELSVFNVTSNFQ
jgi:hypothetical protein